MLETLLSRLGKKLVRTDGAGVKKWRIVISQEFDDMRMTPYEYLRAFRNHLDEVLRQSDDGTNLRDINFKIERFEHKD